MQNKPITVWVAKAKQLPRNQRKRWAMVQHLMFAPIFSNSTRFTGGHLYYRGRQVNTPVNTPASYNPKGYGVL